MQDRTLTSTVTASTPAAGQSSGSARDAFQRVSSAIYGQLLILLGLLVPLSGPAHSDSSDLDIVGYFDLFYIFLLLVSVLFLIFVFIDLVGARTQESLVLRRRRRSVEKVKLKLADSEADSGRSSKSSSELGKICRNRGPRGREEENLQPVQVQLEREESFSSLLLKPTAEYGSFFLRLGTVIAGIGALIYTGIEVGGHLEQELVGSPCNPGNPLLLLAVRPATQIIFILLQTYFLFLNNRMNLYKRKGTSRLGLIHLAATNLCIWLKELIHEVVAAAGADEKSSLSQMEVNLEVNSTSIDINQTRKMGSCQVEGEAGILGNLRMDSMDYLFPLLAQYCFISAAILLVIWNQVVLHIFLLNLTPSH